MHRAFLFLFLFLFSCKEDSPIAQGDSIPLKLYVCDQGSDRVVILDASSDDLEELDVIDIDFSPDVMMETPHFITIDEENGYWFVSTTGSGYIGMYDLDQDTLVSAVFVGDSPALLAADKTSKMLYVSKMMDMGMMMSGGSSNQIEVLSYANNSELIIQDPIDLSDTSDDFPKPHAISIDTNTSMGTSLITASMENDWIARITSSSSYVSSSSTRTRIGFDIAEDGPMPSNSLWPLAATQKDNFMFFSCKGSVTQSIKGQVQLWSLTNLTQGALDVHEFNTNSALWHITSSPIDNRVYVVLSGSSDEPGSAGLACLSYSDTGDLTLEWEITDSSFETLHGITISLDGTRIYVSSRGNGSVYVFNNSGILINTIEGVGMIMDDNMGMSMGSLGGIAITQVQ